VSESDMCICRLKYSIWSKTITMVVVCLFTLNTTCYGLSIMPGSQNPIVKRKICAALARTQLRYAESEETQKLLNDNNAACLLLPSGDYLIRKNIAKDDLQLLQEMVYENVRTLMRIIAHKEQDRYAKIKKIVLEYFPQDKEANLQLNDHVDCIIASAFKWLVLLDEGVLLEREIPKETWDFITQIKQLADDNEELFSKEFWDLARQRRYIKTALENDVEVSGVIGSGDIFLSPRHDATNIFSGIAPFLKIRLKEEFNVDFDITDLENAYLPIIAGVMRLRADREDGKVVVGISAPSGCGKTTFANNLRLLLSVVLGHKSTAVLNQDKFFYTTEELVRLNVPTKWGHGPETIDMSDFNQQIQNFLNSKEISQPNYYENKEDGERYSNGREKLIAEDVLIVEGAYVLCGDDAPYRSDPKCKIPSVRDSYAALLRSMNCKIFLDAEVDSLITWLESRSPGRGKYFSESPERMRFFDSQKTYWKNANIVVRKKQNHNYEPLLLRTTLNCGLSLDRIDRIGLSPIQWYVIGETIREIEQLIDQSVLSENERKKADAVVEELDRLINQKKVGTINGMANSMDDYLLGFISEKEIGIAHEFFKKTNPLNKSLAGVLFELGYIYTYGEKHYQAYDEDFEQLFFKLFCTRKALNEDLLKIFIQDKRTPATSPGCPFSDEEVQKIASIEGVELQPLIDTIKENILRGDQDQGILIISQSLNAGGITEARDNLNRAYNSVKIPSRWVGTIRHENPELFGLSGKIFGLLIGKDALLTDAETALYERAMEQNFENIDFNNVGYVFLDDAYTLGLIPLIKSKHPHIKVIWVVNTDISKAVPKGKELLERYLNQADLVVYLMKEYIPDGVNLKAPNITLQYGINPRNYKNIPLSDDFRKAVLKKYDIAIERPMILQVGRYVPAKDPLASVEAYRKLKKNWQNNRGPAPQLVIAAIPISGDWLTYRRLKEYIIYLEENDEIIDPGDILPLAMDNQFVELTEEEREALSIMGFDPSELSDSDRNALEINALQQSLSVGIHPSNIEGFGLVITEVLVKKKYVVAANIGGIPLQLDREYLVTLDENSVLDTRDLYKQFLDRNIPLEDIHERIKKRAISQNFYQKIDKIFKDDRYTSDNLEGYGYVKNRYLIFKYIIRNLLAIWLVQNPESIKSLPENTSHDIEELIPCYMKYLIDHLEEDIRTQEHDYLYRQSLQRALGYFGKYYGNDAIQVLVDTLDAANKKLFAHIVRSIVFVGEEAVPYLEKALNSDSTTDRQGHVEALMRIGYAGDKSTKKILEDFILKRTGVKNSDLENIFPGMGITSLERTGKIAILFAKLEAKGYDPYIAAHLLKSGIYPTEELIEITNKIIQEDTTISRDDAIKRAVGTFSECINEICSGNFDAKDSLNISLAYTVFLHQLKKKSEIRKADVSFSEFKEILGPLPEAGLEFLKGNAPDLEAKFEAELIYLAHESLVLWDYIMGMKKKADALGRPLVVVANLTQGEIALAPIENRLRRAGIKLIKTRLSSSKTHFNPYFVQPDLFADGDLRYLIAEKPIVTVVDGSNSLRAKVIDRYGARKRVPHFPDSHLGYVNYFAVLSHFLSGSCADVDRLLYAGHMQRVLQERGCDRLRKKMKDLTAASPVGKNENSSYQIGYWYGGEKELGIRAGCVVKGKPSYIKADSINGPAMVFVEYGIEDASMPSSVKSLTAGENYGPIEHAPVYFDSMFAKWGINSFMYEIKIDSKGVHIISRYEENKRKCEQYVNLLEGKKPAFILVGRPGSGKTTIGELLQNSLNIPFVSLGRTVSAMLKTKTPKTPENIYKAIHERLQEEDISDGVILDTNPRDISNLEKFLENNGFFICAVINIDVSEETALKRIETRARPHVSMEKTKPDEVLVAKYQADPTVSRKAQTVLKELKDIVDEWGKRASETNSGKKFSQEKKEVVKDVLSWVTEKLFDQGYVSLYGYGSYATGGMTAGSDLDIMLVYDDDFYDRTEIEEKVVELRALVEALGVGMHVDSFHSSSIEDLEGRNIEMSAHFISRVLKSAFICGNLEIKDRVSICKSQLRESVMPQNTFYFLLANESAFERKKRKLSSSIKSEFYFDIKNSDGGMREIDQICELVDFYAIDHKSFDFEEVMMALNKANKLTEKEVSALNDGRELYLRLRLALFIGGEQDDVVITSRNIAKAASILGLTEESLSYRIKTVSQRIREIYAKTRSLDRVIGDIANGIDHLTEFRTALDSKDREELSAIITRIASKELSQKDWPLIDAIIRNAAVDFEMILPIKKRIDDNKAMWTAVNDRLYRRFSSEVRQYYYDKMTIPVIKEMDGRGLLISVSNEQDPAKTMDELNFAVTKNLIEKLKDLYTRTDEWGQLSERDRGIRDRYMSLLTNQGDNAVGLLIDELENVNIIYDFLYQVQRILGRIGNPAIPALIASLEHPDQKVRAIRSWTLAIIGDESIPYIEDAISGKNISQETRDGLLYALINLSHKGNLRIKSILENSIHMLSGVYAESITTIFTKLNENPIKSLGEIACTINSFSHYKYGCMIAGILFKNAIYPHDYIVSEISQELDQPCQDDKNAPLESIEKVCAKYIEQYQKEIKRIKMGTWDPNSPLHRAIGYTMLRRDTEAINGLTGAKIKMSKEDYEYLLETPDANIEANAELGNAKSLVLKQKAESEYLAYEALKTKEFLARVKMRADQLGLPLMVIENLTYGGIIGSVIEEDLIKMGIKVVKARQSSEMMHVTPTAIQEDLLSDEDLQFILERHPIVVVLDGTTSLSGTIMTKGIRRNRLPHWPDEYQGYQNIFAAINERLGNYDHKENFAYPERILKELQSAAPYKRLKQRLNAIPIDDITKVKYRMMFWQRAKTPLVLRSERESIGMPRYCDSNAANISGPTLLHIQTGMEDKQIPGWLRDRNSAITHSPVYHDLSLQELGMRNFYGEIGIGNAGPYVRSLEDANISNVKKMLRYFEMKRSLFRQFLTDPRHEWFRKKDRSLDIFFEEMYAVFLKIMDKINVIREKESGELTTEESSFKKVLDELDTDQLWNVYIPFITLILLEEQEMTHDRPYIVTISGTTSVGKTTFTHKFHLLLSMVADGKRIKEVITDTFYKKPKRAEIKDKEKLESEICDDNFDIVIAEGMYIGMPDELPDIYDRACLRIAIDAPLDFIKAWKINRTVQRVQSEGGTKTIIGAEKEWNDKIKKYAIDGKKIVNDADVVLEKNSEHEIIAITGVKPAQEVVYKPAVILLGKPGAGKTTVGCMLAKRLGYDTYSLGELLREEERNSVQFKSQEMQTKYQKSFDILRTKLKNCSKGVILDFPRFYTNQYHEIDQFLLDNGFDIKGAILLDISDEAVIKRLYDRNREGEGSIERIERRIESYNARERFYVNHYESKGLLHNVNAEHPIDEVVEECVRIANTTEKSAIQTEPVANTDQEIIEMFLKTEISGPREDIHRTFNLEAKAIQAEYNRLSGKIHKLEKQLEGLSVAGNTAQLSLVLDSLTELQQRLRQVISARKKFIELGFPSYHNHTNMDDDGLFSPQALVEHAVENGITTLYVTGHDSLSGSIKAREYADKSGYLLEIRPAVEIDAPINGATGIMHFVVIGPNNEDIIIDMNQLTLEIFNAMKENYDWRFDRIKEWGEKTIFYALFDNMVNIPEKKRTIEAVGQALKENGFIKDGGNYDEIRQFLYDCFKDIKDDVDKRGKPREVFFNKLDVLGNWTERIESWKGTAKDRRRILRHFFNSVYSDEDVERLSGFRLVRAQEVVKRFASLGLRIVIAHPAYEVNVMKDECSLKELRNFLIGEEGVLTKGYIHAIGAGWSNKDWKMIADFTNGIRKEANIGEKDFPIVRNIPDFHGHKGQDIVLGIFHAEDNMWTWDPAVRPLDFESFFEDGEYLTKNHVQQAKLHITKGQYFNAIRELTKVLETDPYNPAYSELISIAYAGIQVQQDDNVRNKLSHDITAAVKDYTIGEDMYDHMISIEIDKDVMGVLMLDVMYSQLKEERTFTIQYDQSRLSPSQVDIIKKYSELLDDKCIAKVKAVGCSSEKGSPKKLITVTCSDKQEKKLGEGTVDVLLPDDTEDINDYLLKIIGLLNIALLTSGIPEETPEEEIMSKYGTIVSLIRFQYNAIIGNECKISELLPSIRNIVIIIPKACKMPTSKIEEYNRLTREALIRA